MNITIFPYQPFQIKNGIINLIEIEAPSVYTSIVQSLRDATDLISLSDEHFQTLENGKSLAWYGDPLYSINLESLFQKRLLKYIASLIDPSTETEMIDLQGKLKNTVLNTLFSIDLPLEVSPTNDLNTILKNLGIMYNESVKKDVGYTLETLIKTCEELNDTRVIALTNVSHYLTSQMWQTFVETVQASRCRTLLIEFSHLAPESIRENANLMLIDKDFLEEQKP